MFDLGQVHVEGLIVHEVPKHFLHATTNPDPILSEVESPTEATVRNFFRERMAAALGMHAYEVELDAASGSPLPALIKALLSKNPPDFVKASQSMALHLHCCQGGASPGGLLTVIRGRVGNRPAIAIMKLEKEEGTRVQRVQTPGQKTYSVSHVRDLMLTGKTKVFKVGLFSTTEPGEVRGLVCDKQRMATTTVAYFFLQTFLGCQLVETAEITTKRSWEVAETFINDEIADPEVKGRYQVAIAAEMGANRTSVSLESFATTYLDEADQAPFLQREQEANVPIRSFPKDTKLIEPQLRRIQWSFQSDVSVLASADTVGNQVTVAQLDDGRTQLQVTDNLKDVKGHR